MKLLDNQRIWSVVGVFLALQGCLFGAATAAEIVTINFDTFPDGTPVPEGTGITNQYADVGVIISEGFGTEDVSGDSSSFVGASLPNILTSGGFAPGPGGSLGCHVDFKARFVSPVSSVSILVFTIAVSPPQTIQLLAKDLDGNIIDQDSFLVTAGSFPADSVTLNVSSSPLSIASIETAGGADNALCIGVDNLSFSQRVVNDLVTFDPIRSTFTFTPDTTGCPEGLVGKFSFEAQLTNISDSSLSDLVVEVTALTNGNLLQNADGGPGGVGARLTVPRQDGFSDGVLTVDEFVDVPFLICLLERSPFNFFVDVLGVSGRSATQIILSYLSPNYRFLVVPFGQGSGFEQPGFDDSQFDVGNAAFGTGGFCPLDSTVETVWPLETDILLRKTFTLPANASSVSVAVAIDNDVQVFINGVDVSGGLQENEGCAERDRFVFSVPDSLLIFGGENLLAVRGRDRGVISYIDVEVRAEILPF